MPATTQDPLPSVHPNTSDIWETELFSFETDTDITGQIPMRISVTNGVVFFGHLHMNYRKNNTPIPPVDFFGKPNINTIASDGISNTVKNGQPWNWRVSVTDQELGDWAYPVKEGETFTFDFDIDPSLIALNP
jgi:hypothetical protein